MMVKIISREKRVETLILRSESGESYENCGNNNPYRIIFYYTVLTQNLLAIPHTHGYRCKERTENHCGWVICIRGCLARTLVHLRNTLIDYINPIRASNSIWSTIESSDVKRRIMKYNTPPIIATRTQSGKCSELSVVL